jgi:hypothetical protein
MKIDGCGLAIVQVEVLALRGGVATSDRSVGGVNGKATKCSLWAIR